MLHGSLMMESALTVQEREFAFDYFSHGAVSEEDSSIKFGGVSSFNGKHIIVFSGDSRMEVLRDAAHAGNEGNTFDIYGAGLDIFSEDDLWTIYNERAQTGYGTYFKYWIIGDPYPYIGYARTISSVTLEMDEQMGIEVPNVTRFLLLSSFEDVDLDFNPFCTGDNNMLCTFYGLQATLGRLQSDLIQAIDDGTDIYEEAQISATIDHENKYGTQYNIKPRLLEENGFLRVTETANLRGMDFLDYILNSGVNSDTYTDIFEFILDDGVGRGNTISSFLIGVDESASPVLTFVGPHFHDDRTNNIQATYLTYKDVPAPVQYIHELETEKLVFNPYSAENVQSMLGNLVHVIIKKNTRLLFGLKLLAEAKDNGLEPFMFGWLPDEEGTPQPWVFDVPSSTKEAINNFPKPICEATMDGTSALVCVEELFNQGIISRNEWNIILAGSTEESAWMTFQWSRQEYIGMFFDITRYTGTRLVFGFAMKDTPPSFDENCPFHNTLPCSDESLYALLSLASRDIALHDARSSYTLGSTGELSPEGGMSLLVIDDQDDRMVLNTLASDMAGLLLEDWRWDGLEDLLVTLREKITER
eukprot:TRINITY_DN4668_c0_g1_i3.p1 TRINITY_DN4668_c0_g1~~TRINITY_DN4668_c0_g1_i3.p1  ORF type:complete len:675 (-),score=194.60 TRINITY_DN4668_c0_g1_i3:273-2033(-)